MIRAFKRSSDSNQDIRPVEQGHPYQAAPNQDPYGLMQCLINAFLGANWHSQRNI